MILLFKWATNSQTKWLVKNASNSSNQTNNSLADLRKKNIEPNSLISALLETLHQQGHENAFAVLQKVVQSDSTGIPRCC